MAEESLNIQDAAQILHNDIQELNNTNTQINSSLQNIINSPAPAALLDTLNDNNIETINVSDFPMQTAEDRVSSILIAGHEHMNEQSIPAPVLEPYYIAQNIAQKTGAPMAEVIQDVKLARSLQIGTDNFNHETHNIEFAQQDVVLARVEQGFSSPSQSESTSIDGSNDHVNDAGETTKPNNDLNVEPVDYTNIEVRLQAYEIGSAPLVGEYGHAFLEYEDLTTGDVRYARAGPTTPGYPGGVIDAIRDRAFSGVNVEALDNDKSEQVDAGIPGTFEVNSFIIRGNMDELEAQFDKFNQTINDEDIPYKPRSQNSNTYAGDTYELVTGQEPDNNTDVRLPGLNNDLMDYEETEYSAAFD